MLPFCALVVCLLAGLASAGEASIFSSQQLATLRSARLKIVAPRTLPSGFRVHGVYVDPDFRDTPDVSYAILYVGPQHACIVTEVAGGGIGDMIIQDAAGHNIEPTKQLRNATFGTTAFWNTREYLGTDWFYRASTHQTGPFVSVRGDIDRTSVPRLAPKTATHCRRPAPTALQQLAESLDYAPDR
ncbi:MAG: hypothetical protein HY696_07750 [Deltaproteobacteria bacterium]|nr:hypothetical protein [Deltaproteobacteria bacterium]